jgi:2-oxoisovalerate dehydrogenase E1 component
MPRQIQLPSPAACHRLETDDADIQAIGRAALIEMLFLLHLIRAFETAVLELKDADLIHGPVHASIGQEAVAAAVSVALRRTDKIASTHRAHGHFLGKAMAYYAPQGYNPLRDPVAPAMQQAIDRTLAEIMGLADGWCGGRGGSMHLYDATSGNLGSNAIVGGGIPIATGAAWAARLQGQDDVVVSYFGDGAINQGCFHEAANMAALWDVPVLYLVENNLYAVGTCTNESSYVEDLALRTLGHGFDSLIVDGMDPVNVYCGVRDAVEQMRERPFPFLIEAKTYRYYHHGGGLPGSAFGYRDKIEEQAWQERDPLVAFPERLLRLGLLTEEEHEVLREKAGAAVAAAVDGYTVTQDDARSIPSEAWPPAGSATREVRCEEEELFADVTFVEQEDWDAFEDRTYVQAIAAVTLDAMQRDERVIVLGEEVANLRGGAYAATRGILEECPERLINTPISETGFIGMAGGLASVGLRPVVEIMFPDFALMASDQLFNQIGKLRHMYGGQVCFPIVVRTRVAMGFGYGGQHSMDPSGFFGLFSGWRVVAPSNAYDYIGLFNTAMRFRDPVLIVEHGMLYGEEGEVPAGRLDYHVPYGKAKVVRSGKDVTVLTYLTGLGTCLEAAAALAEKGLSAEVIDLRTLDYTGMDWATIGASVQKTGSVLIVEQAPRSMTLGGRIADEIQARFFDYLDCPVGHVTGLDIPLPVSRALEDTALPSLEQIEAQMARGARHMF